MSLHGVHATLEGNKRSSPVICRTLNINVSCRTGVSETRKFTTKITAQKKSFPKLLNTCVFRYVKDHQESGITIIEKHNKATAPYIFAKSATDILEKLNRGRETLNKLQTVFRLAIEYSDKLYKGEMSLSMPSRVARGIRVIVLLERALKVFRETG